MACKSTLIVIIEFTNTINNHLFCETRLTYTYFGINSKFNYVVLKACVLEAINEKRTYNQVRNIFHSEWSV